MKPLPDPPLKGVGIRGVLPNYGRFFTTEGIDAVIRKKRYEE